MIALAGGALHVDGGGAGKADGAGGKDFCPRGGQHPAHIGMGDDRPHLLALGRIGHGLLQGRLGDADALHPHAQPGAVHHREHGGHALVFGADQPAGRALIGHHAGRAAMDAQLFLEADHLQIVGDAGLAIRVGNEFRHHEQADPARAGRRVRQPRQHRVADILRHIAVAPGDIDLLPADRIAAVAVGFGPGDQRAHIAARAGLGQVHRARPFAGNQPGQIQRLHLVAGVMFQRLDLALRQQRVQLQRQAGAGHHLGHGHVQRLRQTHAAMIRVGGQPDPAALGNGREAFGKAGRGSHPAVFQPRGMLVSGAVQRRQHGLGQLAGLGQDGGRGFLASLGKPFGRGQFGIGDDMAQDERNLLDGCPVSHLPLPHCARLASPPRAIIRLNLAGSISACRAGSTETPRHGKAKRCRPNDWAPRPKAWPAPPTC